MPVGEDGVHVGGIVGHALAVGPAVVGARCAPIYFLPGLRGILSTSFMKMVPRAGLDGELVGVAQAQCPDGSVLA